MNVLTIGGIKTMKTITFLMDLGIAIWVFFNLCYWHFNKLTETELLDSTGFSIQWWGLFMIASIYIRTILKQNQND